MASVAVVGGGLFGATAAIKVSEAVPGARVDLFEKTDDLLKAASEINQCRLHRGYHYPRSKETSITCRNTAEKFYQEYTESIVTEYDHYYCIASSNSKTTPAEFIDHCAELGLSYERVDLDVVNDENIDLTVRVNEDQVDPVTLRAVCWDRLENEGVTVHLNHEVESVDELDHYDYVVVATYSHLNRLLSSYPDLRAEYKYQVIEKPVAAVPESFHEKSLIVLDGPFMGINPFGQEDEFHFDHVVHGVRHSNTGTAPELGDVDEGWLNDGIIEDVPDSNYREFIRDGKKFFNGIEASEWQGSKFTIRAVLPNVEATDARPTIVERSSNVIMIFSGKLTTCVDAADQVVDSIRSEVP